MYCQNPHPMYLIEFTDLKYPESSRKHYFLRGHLLTSEGCCFLEERWLFYSEGEAKAYIKWFLHKAKKEGFLRRDVNKKYFKVVKLTYGVEDVDRDGLPEFLWMSEEKAKHYKDFKKCED